MVQLLNIMRSVKATLLGWPFNNCVVLSIDKWYVKWSKFVI